jgi:Skp family chaperone for outer membrane proteins
MGNPLYIRAIILKNGTIFSNLKTLVMKKILILIAFVCFTQGYSQGSKGPKIGYFDMDVILKAVPEFAEANNQLELKAQQWKRDIDERQNKITALKEELKTERVLLTKELIEEKEEEIAFLEKELTDYTQKRFGPTGDFFTQKTVLVKPIQDQVFTIINDIAERRKYDFVFDRSSDVTMVFAAKKFNMNEEIINSLDRSNRREQATRKREIKELDKEQIEDDKKYDPELREKEEIRQAKVDERKSIQEQRRQEQEDKRQKAIEERQKQMEDRKNQQNQNAQTSNRPAAQTNQADDDSADVEEEKTTIEGEDSEEETTEEAKPKPSTKDERQKAIEDRKKQIQEQREAQQKARQEAAEKRKKEIEDKRQQKNKTEENSTPPAETTEEY